MTHPTSQKSCALWQRAASFAAMHHAGQLRKDGVTPYIAHPIRVAMTVRDLFNCSDTIAICTALLHDTIEDTLADYDDILRLFGREIADCVACVTKDKRLPDERRESAFYRQIAAGPWQARLVKLADALDNATDAIDESMRQRAIGKARMAIQVAGDEPQILAAAGIVREQLGLQDASS